MTAQEFIEAVAIGKNRRKDIAFRYAELLREHAISPNPFPWYIVNEAILMRWSRAGLRYIKELAWKIVEGREPKGSGDAK